MTTHCSRLVWTNIASFSLLLLTVECLLTSCTSHRDQSTPHYKPSTPHPKLASLLDSFPFKQLPSTLKGAHLDTAAAAVGIVGPTQTFIAAIPLNGGGSGGALALAIYGVVGGAPSLIQVLNLSDSLAKVSIADNRLKVLTEEHRDSDPHCCPSGMRTSNYGINETHLQLLSSNVAWKPGNLPNGFVLESPTPPYAQPTPVLTNIGHDTLVPPAAGNGCDEDTIQTVSDDGTIIATSSGSVWRVDPGDESTSMVWLPAEDVLICDDDKIINKDESGESVGVSREK